MQKKFSKSSMTLMEVIAVMTIITVLLTILLPTVFKAREWGKNIKCRSNIKAVGNAIQSYTNDFGGLVPPSYDYGKTLYGSVAVFWTDFLIDPCSSKYTQKRAATPKNGIINSQSVNVSGGYIPVPNVKRDPVTSGLSYRYLTSPADYSSVLACPSEPINWRNETLTKQMGISSSTDISYIWWNGSHYAAGLLAPLKNSTTWCTKMNAWKSLDKRALTGDSYSANTIETLNSNDSMIYGRHFGQVYYPAPFAWSSGMGYRAHGSGRANWMMMDGSMRAWSWMSFYMQYPSTASYNATSNSTPFVRTYAGW